MKYTRAGFTIIELITVVAITAIISIVSVSVLVNSQVRGTKSTTINKVRTEGSFLLDRISFLLRNARYVEENQFGATCQSGMESIRVRAHDGGLIEVYRTDDNRVASNSGEVITDPPTSYLSSEGVQIDSLLFSCQQAEGQSGAILDVRFTVSTGNPDTLSPEAYHSESFSTQVYVRSFQ